MNAPALSVIVVSWNTRTYLARCLASIPQAARPLVFEVIVVDNGSSDGTQTLVATQFPDVRLIQNEENVGYGRATNIGVKASRGQFLLVLNGDCELAPGALTTMIEVLDREPSLAGVFCRLLNTDGSLQPSVHRSLPSPWSLFGELLFLSTMRHALYRRPALHRWLLPWTIKAHRHPHDVAWGGGACMVVRREAFEAVGGFDEGFFMYCEDMDICKRICALGFRLRYLPGPSVIHHWGKATRQLPAVMLREAYRSRIYYFEKHFPGWGGHMARALALFELLNRWALCSALALIPSRSRAIFRSRAEASAACVRD
ncbi:MAG: glycosyltransferase family 2 protein, partial [Nitrospirales bacterium]